MSREPFKAKPGQVDYTNIRWAPVINCVLKHGDRFLLVQRSKDMKAYPGQWTGISGYLDDHKSLEEKVREELREELGLGYTSILKIEPGVVFDEDSPQYEKTWIVHPILVTVNTDDVNPDWESQDHGWFTIAEIGKLKLMPGFDQVLKSLKLF